MSTADWRNKLYFGCNLDILRGNVAYESVDLIYLDPPFNSVVQSCLGPVALQAHLSR